MLLKRVEVEPVEVRRYLTTRLQGRTGQVWNRPRTYFIAYSQDEPQTIEVEASDQEEESAGQDQRMVVMNGLTDLRDRPG